MSENTILDMDSILDGTLDTITEAPDFVTPPEGLYILQTKKAELEKYKSKDGAKHGLRIKVLHTVVSTVELADTKELPVADGSMFSETFQADEQGLSYFKKAARKYLQVENLDGVSIRDILSSLEGSEPFDAKIKIRKTPNPAGGVYENVQIQVVEKE